MLRNYTIFPSENQPFDAFLLWFDSCSPSRAEVEGLRVVLSGALMIRQGAVEVQLWREKVGKSEGRQKRYCVFGAQT